MKNKLVIVMLTLTAAMLFASFAGAMATEHAVDLTISNQEIVWTIDTLKLFSGKDVLITTIEVKYYYYEDPENPTVLLEGIMYPVKISQGGWQVKLWFDEATFPNGAEYSVVKGQIAGGDTFSAQGPGWAYRWF